MRHHWPSLGARWRTALCTRGLKRASDCWERATRPTRRLQFQCYWCHWALICGATVKPFSSMNQMKPNSVLVELAQQLLASLQTCKWESWLTAVSCWARRFLTHFGFKSSWITLLTVHWLSVVSLTICRVVRWVCGTSSWLSTMSQTALSILSGARTERGCPLPGCLSAVSILWILHSDTSSSYPLATALNK